MYFLPIPIRVHLKRCGLEHSFPRRESIPEPAEARFHLCKCLGPGEEKGGIVSIDIRRRKERSYPRNIRICIVNEHIIIKKPKYCCSSCQPRNQRTASAYPYFMRL